MQIISISKSEKNYQEKIDQIFHKYSKNPDINKSYLLFKIEKEDKIEILVIEGTRKSKDGSITNVKRFSFSDKFKK